MKPSILLLAVFAAAFTSCTTAYKTGQTPDDVYYSPSRPQDEYVRVDDDREDEYRYDEEYYDDRYLRMRVRNRQRWSQLDDWYFYDRNYGYSYYNSLYWGNPWTPYATWNNFYNPYCPTIIVNPGVKNTYNKPRTSNLNTYTNTQTAKNNPKLNQGRYINTNSNSGSSRPRNVNTRSSSGNGSNSGNILRDIFGGGDNNNSSSSGASKSSSNTNSSSSSSSSSSGSKSSGSSSGGSAPVRRF
jgi:hypothetical protein